MLFQAPIDCRLQFGANQWWKYPTGFQNQVKIANFNLEKFARKFTKFPQIRHIRSERWEWAHNCRLQTNKIMFLLNLCNLCNLRKFAKILRDSNTFKCKICSQSWRKLANLNYFELYSWSTRDLCDKCEFFSQHGKYQFIFILIPHNLHVFLLFLLFFANEQMQKYEGDEKIYMLPWRKVCTA